MELPGNMQGLQHNPVPPLSPLERAALVDSIAAYGILTPVVKSKGPARKGDLVDGFHRTEIAADLGIAVPFVEVIFNTETEFLIAQLELNVKRRQLPVGQKILIGMQLDPLERELSRERMLEGKGAVGTTRDQIGAKIGVSGTTYERGKRILESGYADLVESFLAGDISVSEGIRRIKNRERLIAIKQVQVGKTVTPPTGKYNVIVADPPWPTEGTPYPVQTYDQIATLPVQDLADENCILWLWVINGLADLGFSLIKHWGFTHKTILTWDKRSSAPGWYLNGQTEHVLVAIKGNPTIVNAQHSTLLSASRREHSRKPDEFYELVDRICVGSKIDLYARQSRVGWDTWGAENTKFDSPG